jgi:hypothetical protein
VEEELRTPVSSKTEREELSTQSQLLLPNELPKKGNLECLTQLTFRLSKRKEKKEVIKILPQTVGRQERELLNPSFKILKYLLSLSLQLES